MSTELRVLEDEDEVRLRTWTQLSRTCQQVQKRITAALLQAGVTLAQFDVLATLHYTEGLTQQELADWLLVTKGNVTGVLDRLAGCGWTERRADQRDARANRIFLTAAGRSKIAEVLPLHDRLVLQLLSQCGLQQVSALRDGLRVLERAAQTS